MKNQQPNQKQNKSSRTSALAILSILLGACGGGGGGGNGGGGAAQKGPALLGFARFQDRDGDGRVSPDDAITIAFNRAIDASSSSPAEFVLPVEGDSFGTGARVVEGPAANEATILLGTDAKLRSRGRFAEAATSANSPSGVSVNAVNSIVDVDGRRAVVTSPRDVTPQFASDNAAVGGSNVVGIAVGDINWDRKRDVVVATADKLLLNIGNGSFAMTPAGELSGSGIRGLAISNLNRAMADEIVTYHDGFTQVWNNSGSSSQGPRLSAGQKLTTGDTRAIALADFNGNGKIDIVTASADGVRVFIHQPALGNTYTLGTSLLNLSNATSLAAFDADADGDIDVIVGRTGSVPARLLTNNGVGVMTDAGPIGIANVTDLAFGDVDGDGDVDVVAARESMSTILLVNNGRGVFAASEIAEPADQARLEDVDSDGHADLVTCRGAETRLWMNSRTNGFEDSGFHFSQAGTKIIELSDVDGDADADLMIAGAAGVDMFRGSLVGTQGSTTFVSNAQLGLSSSNAIAMGDIDGDGDLDKIVANLGANHVYFNDGSGTFSHSAAAPHTLGSSDSRSVVLGDLDDDGDLDIVFGNTGTNGAPNTIYANDGAGNFELKQTFSPLSKTLALVLTKFDGDGKPDIVVGNDGVNEVLINQTNNSIIAFVAATAPFSAANSARLALETIALIARDIDTDGDDDLIVLNNGTELSPQETQIFRKATVVSTTIYTLYRKIHAARITWSMAMGDWDRDGIADLAIASATTDGKKTVQIHRGFRIGFATLPTFALDTGAKVESRGMALTDVDGDGQADLILANFAAKSEVWIADGQGGFARQQVLENDATTGLAMGDIDGDGDLDAITSVASNAGNRVYSNR